MQSAIEIIHGETVSYSGVVTLPAGTWTADSSFSDPQSGEQVTLHVDLTLIGANLADPTRYDWAIRLHATSAETAAWVKPPLRTKRTLEGRIRFQDNSPTPVVKNTRGVRIELSQ